MAHGKIIRQGRCREGAARLLARCLASGRERLKRSRRSGGAWVLAALPLAILLPGCGNGDSSPGPAWPSRPIQIVCFSSAGGDTDTISRTLARVKEPLLGVRINVINKTGAHGGNAMRDVWSRRHDGYRWGGFSVTTLIAPVMGGHHTTAEDWTFFIIAGAPGLISVRADSPYQSLDELVAAAKASPGEINAAASTVGGVWHTKLIALESAAGITFNFVPYNGSNPSQLALLTGEVEVVLTSVSEQAELIRSGRMRPLATLAEEPYEFPELGAIPTVARNYPEAAALPIEQWIGLALPAGTPPEVLELITESFEQAMRSEEVSQMLANRLLTPYGWHGAEADRRVRQTQASWTWMLHDLGITEKSPAEFGIARP